MIFVDSHIGDLWVKSVKIVTEIAGIKSVLLLVKLIINLATFSNCGKLLITLTPYIVHTKLV